MRPLLGAVAAIGIVATVLSLAGCGSQRANPSASASRAVPSPRTSIATHDRAETPLPAESNPPGDIPDTQAFVVYASRTYGFRIDAPEGWSRTQSGGTVTFQDKFDGESVEIVSDKCTSGKPPSALAETLSHAGHAATNIHITSVTLPAGLAQYAEYETNSAPEPVTGKRVRLAQNAYLLERGGHCALIELWAPKGADNVDQWQRIARSFRWS
jgi:hypothetical protein